MRRCQTQRGIFRKAAKQTANDEEDAAAVGFLCGSERKGCGGSGGREKAAEVKAKRWRRSKAAPAASLIRITGETKRQRSRMPERPARKSVSANVRHFSIHDPKVLSRFLIRTAQRAADWTTLLFDLLPGGRASQCRQGPFCCRWTFCRETEKEPKQLPAASARFQQCSF